MKPLIFKEIWDSVWPNRKMELTGLKAVWGPEVKPLADLEVIGFLRRWARQQTWPPSLHEFLSGMGVAKVPASSTTRQVGYRCEHCGTKIQGWVEYDRHLASEHADKAADPEKIAAMIADWRKKHRAAKSRGESEHAAVAESTDPDPGETPGEVSGHSESAVSGEPPPL